MSELTLEDFFAESETYGESAYGRIPEQERRRINEILRELFGEVEQPEEPPEEPGEEPPEEPTEEPPEEPAPR